jgi:peptidyl-prolyl cis-trans isomerase A (cyclophilin A)
MSFAAPLSCKQIKEMQKESAMHIVQRRIQQEGIEEDVAACLQKNKLSQFLPKPDADLIAPEHYTALVQTTKGDFLIELHREWAPIGVDRFYTLIQKGFFQELPFFRVIRGFMAQFGIHTSPLVNQSWRAKPINDDPSIQSNSRGMISFATAGPNTRTTQLFINTTTNTTLDTMGFTPIGSVVHRPSSSGMEVVDRLFSGYGEGHPSGRGPSQDLLQNIGTDFLKEHYPHIDYIRSIRICSNPNPIQTTECDSAG